MRIKLQCYNNNKNIKIFYIKKIKLKRNDLSFGVL